MTKKDAVNKLMKEYQAPEVFRNFFERTVEELVGSGNFVDAQLFQDIRTYISKIT